MTLAALQHLVHAARVLADDCTVYVLGSSSLLARFPELERLPAPWPPLTMRTFVQRPRMAGVIDRKPHLTTSQPTNTSTGSRKGNEYPAT